jgi:hypothetical protein
MHSVMNAIGQDRFIVGENSGYANIFMYTFSRLQCGNPMQLGRCYQCKAEIGGESAELREDNLRDAG